MVLFRAISVAVLREILVGLLPVTSVIVAHEMVAFLFREIMAVVFLWMNAV